MPFLCFMIDLSFSDLTHRMNIKYQLTFVSSNLSFSDLKQLRDLFIEIKKICGNEDFDEGSDDFASGYTILNNKAASEASEKKITEIDESDESPKFPTLTRTHRFLENVDQRF
ncbi:23297_t:CDS:2 [Dentiscutata erythropus]|uniref:23297_t:CDS:1 n=1 Tax=Dentiscutata erythropus TaxID=1348616 RepID=A0A9N9PB26_9GLOM|nr:23297_t:CDS:2 [Dentiscutata erythropus]